MQQERPVCTIQPPPNIHPIIPVEELRGRYAILQSKRQSCELQHWCISLVTISLFFSTIALILCGFMIVRHGLKTLFFPKFRFKIFSKNPKKSYFSRQKIIFHLFLQILYF